MAWWSRGSASTQNTNTHHQHFTYRLKCSNIFSSLMFSGKFPTQRCLVSLTILRRGLHGACIVVYVVYYEISSLIAKTHIRSCPQHEMIGDTELQTDSADHTIRDVITRPTTQPMGVCLSITQGAGTASIRKSIGWFHGWACSKAVKT